MSRNINADSLAEEIKSLSVYLGGKELFTDEAKKSVLQIINNQPTVEATLTNDCVQELKENINESILGTSDFAEDMRKTCHNAIDNMLKQGTWEKWDDGWFHGVKCSSCGKKVATYEIPNECKFCHSKNKLQEG